MCIEIGSRYCSVLFRAFFFLVYLSFSFFFLLWLLFLFSLHFASEVLGLLCSFDISPLYMIDTTWWFLGGRVFSLWLYDSWSIWWCWWFLLGRVILSIKKKLKHFGFVQGRKDCAYNGKISHGTIKHFQGATYLSCATYPSPPYFSEGLDSHLSDATHANGETDCSLTPSHLTSRWPRNGPITSSTLHSGRFYYLNYSIQRVKFRPDPS